MRLPWPFGRRTSADGPPSHPAEDGGAGVAGGRETAAVPARPAPPTGAWATLPPIQRTVGSAPLVAPAAPFLDHVPGHRPLPPIVTPLGHEAGPSAPPGLVVAHVRPVPVLTSHAELPTRPIQRRASAEPATAGLAAATADDAATESPRAASPGGAPRAESPAAAPHAAAAREPETPPVRRVAAVSPGAAVSPPPRPLTRAPAELPPLAATRTHRAPASQGGPGAVTPTAGSPTAAASRASTPGAALPKTMSRWSEGAPSATPAAARAPAAAAGTPEAGRASPSAAGSGTHDGPGIHEPPGPGAGPALAGSGRRALPRRPGLGAPISVPPANAVAQRLPNPASAARPKATSGSPTSTVMAPGAEYAPGGDAGRRAVVARPLPVLPVSRRHRDHQDRPSSSPETALAPAGTPGRAATPATPAPSPVRPTLGSRPLRPGVTTQRVAGASTPSTTGPAPVAPVPVVARWEPRAGLPDTVTSVPVQPDSAWLPVQLMPFPAAPAAHEAAPGPQALPGDLREMRFPARAAAPSDTSPASPGLAAPTSSRTSHSPSDRSVLGAGAIPVAGPGAAAGRAATRERPLTLARTVAAAPAPASAAAGGSTSTSVSNRIVAEPTAPATSPAAASRPADAIPAITATPVVQRVEGGAPPASSATGSQGHSEVELDELAKALFGRFRTHLRAEVIHDREARGLTFDAF